jgi:uncharacterized repeat protein (TIGR01451 family)
MKRHVLVLLTAALAFLPISAASAGTGDTLREITAANPQSCAPFNVGLAFDGTNLLVSCVGSGVIDEIDPSDGSLVGQITVAGESVLGALSYDRTRGKLWACTFGGAERVMLIDPADGSKDAEFASNGCGDGLAYDGREDTLWAGADQVCDVTNYETDGTVIGAFDVCPLIGGFGKSGIAVGDGKLYVASPSLSRVYEVEKDFSASSLLFQSNRFLEDLECDDVTFAPKSAMWVQAAFDRILTAVEIPAGACPFGGDPSLADLSITKTDSPDPLTLPGNLTYTLTVANAGPDAAAAVTVTDTLPAGVSFVSATASVGSCSGTVTITCTLGSLANGASATVAIVVTPTAANPALSNTATVTATTTDPVSANNSAGATTVVEVEEASQLDDFKCYALREGDDDDDGGAARPRVTLEDQFGSGEARVGAAAELCNPVSKDGGTINQESAHLVKYKARAIGRTFAKRRVEVTNQFGTQILTVRRPTILAVPSSKNVGGSPGDPPTMLDHFQCYRFVELDDGGGAFRPRTVVLKDQFKEESVRVRRPVALCNPVAKTHAGHVSPIGSPDEHLVCYTIRAAPFAARVNVRNQFGDATLRVRRPVSLCVPSQKSEASNHVVIATAPGSHLVDSTTLRGAFSVLNTGDLVADSVEITKIELPNTTVVSPALPLSVGTIAGDASVPVSVEFSGGPFTPDQTYPLHVEGTFTINHVRHSFVSDLTLAIPPSAPGSATVDTMSVDANAVDGGHFPHQPLGFENEVNQPRWTVPTGHAAPGTPTPAKTDVRPAPFGDPPAIQFDRNTSLGLTSGTTNGTAGSIAEPSGASSGGGVVFATANWTAAYSTDGGATFTQLDPTTIFPSDAVGFCCDQVVQYVPSIDRFIWVLQGNGYRLASASPSDIINSGGTAWTYWNLTPSIFGALTGTGFDYPDVSVGNNSLYVSWDAGFPCPTNCNWGFQVARISLSAIQASGTISIDFTDPANGRDAWGSHLMQDTGNESFWAGHEENDIVRVFSLAENSNTYFWRDVGINGWPNNALSSLTPDNQNWLTGSNGFPGNAIIGATRTGNDLWFAWMAGTDRGFTQPHIEMISVDRGRNFQKTQQVQIWNDNYAFGYPALATNGCTGEVGLSFEFGGGGNYENHVVGFWGDFVAYITTGTNVGTTRFGDYVSIRQAPVTEEAPGNLFDAFGYGLLKVPPPGTGTNTDIHYVRFGRPASNCIG